LGHFVEIESTPLRNTAGAAGAAYLVNKLLRDSSGYAENVRLRDSLMTAIPEFDEILTCDSLSQNLHHVILVIEGITSDKTDETPISVSPADSAGKDDQLDVWMWYLSASIITRSVFG
jgi:hypothetical protein